jgi:hypothetical protein
MLNNSHTKMQRMDSPYITGPKQWHIVGERRKVQITCMILAAVYSNSLSDMMSPHKLCKLQAFQIALSFLHLFPADIKEEPEMRAEQKLTHNPVLDIYIPRACCPLK